MPLEHVPPDAVLPIAERRNIGRQLRKIVPRSQHAAWRPAANRRDPVQMLVDNGRHLLSHLAPLRYQRMRASAFAFLRGSAAIMAADLAGTPTSGLHVQSCGDCHLANFGVFAARDGVPVFDVNDFDETLPAPFEWDLKRLAASFAVDARGRGLPERMCRHLARVVVQAYRGQMNALGPLDPLSAWHHRIDVAALLNEIEDPKLRARELKRLTSIAEAGRRGYPRLLHRQQGEWRIRPRPPLIVPLSGQADDTHEVAARAAFDSYKSTVAPDRRLLLNRYRLADLAFKVVGIGSVGTFCAIGLFTTAEGATLLLQMKEARNSVLAPYAGSSCYGNQGQRVVVGQRIMQSESDMFLGWTQDRADDQHCYVRQLKDGRLALIGGDFAEVAKPHHAMLCGVALARAHARSGDAVRISGYMGSGGAFDSAIADFAIAYAEQVERDYLLFLEAIKAGVIEARAA
jgi:uncharacterized protein (DUF2252 family)